MGHSVCRSMPMCLEKYTIQYTSSSRPVIGQCQQLDQSQACNWKYTVWHSSPDTLAYFYKLSGPFQLVVISTESSLCISVGRKICFTIQKETKSKILPAGFRINYFLFSVGHHYSLKQLVVIVLLVHPPEPLRIEAKAQSHVAHTSVEKVTIEEVHLVWILSILT